MLARFHRCGRIAEHGSVTHELCQQDSLSSFTSFNTDKSKSNDLEEGRLIPRKLRSLRI